MAIANLLWLFYSVNDNYFIHSSDALKSKLIFYRVEVNPNKAKKSNVNTDSPIFGELFFTCSRSSNNESLIRRNQIFFFAL